METLLKSFETMKEWLLSIAKSLKDGKTEEASESLNKTVDALEDAVSNFNEVAKSEDNDSDNKEDDDEEDDKGEDVSKSEDKVTLEVTKSQAEALIKYADMYISWDQLWKVLAALSESWVEIEDLFKTVQSNSEAIEKISDPKSKQISKTTSWNGGVRDSLDLV